MAIPKNINAKNQEPKGSKYKRLTNNIEIIVKIDKDFLVDSLMSIIAPINGADINIEKLQITKAQFK